MQFLAHACCLNCDVHSSSLHVANQAVYFYRKLIPQHYCMKVSTWSDAGWQCKIELGAGRVDLTLKAAQQGRL
jgi:hypothetical protein